MGAYKIIAALKCVILVNFVNYIKIKVYSVHTDFYVNITKFREYKLKVINNVIRILLTLETKQSLA